MNGQEPIDVERLLATGLVARVDAFETLGSTQDHATTLARGDAGPLPLVVIAEEQTTGRGRGANRWWTGRGSLAFTLVFDLHDWALSQHPLPERSLAMGVAIVDTLAPHLPGRRVGMHWPNDVYVEGRKISGILVDVLSGGRYVVGIGINVNNPLAAAPEDVRARAVSMCELADRQFDRTELLAALLGNIRLAVRQASDPSMEFGLRFNELCLQIGHPLTIDVAGRRTTGICAGIAPDGCLLLETTSGFERFYSGVLVHSPPAK